MVQLHSYIHANKNTLWFNSMLTSIQTKILHGSAPCLHPYKQKHLMVQLHAYIHANKKPSDSTDAGMIHFRMQRYDVTIMNKTLMLLP